MENRLAHPQPKTAELLPALFNPKSIAIVGASRDEESISFGILKNLLLGNFKGRLYPVNPKADSILGLKSYKSLLDIEEEVQLALIAVPRQAVPEILDDCGEKNIKAAVIITAGFKEIGEKGRGLEEKIIRIAQSHGITFLGPNCLGIINSAPEVQMNATFARRKAGRGNVSFLSQSGAVGVYGLEYAAENGIGFSKFVSLGNKAMLNENHMLELLAHDSATKVILAYLENLSEPRAFIDAASRITRGEKAKPILAIKSGRSESGKRAVASHTGALSQRDDVLSFLFRQGGVIRVGSIEELFSQALCLSEQPLPAGNRLAILTNAGGPAIIAADEAERLGAKIPELSDGLKKKLMEGLPETVSVRNPVDLVGDAGAGRYEHALKTILESGEADALLVICTPQMMTDMEEIATLVTGFADTAREKGITLMTSFASFEEVVMEKAERILRAKKIPNYPFVENAVKACATAIRFTELSRRPAGETPTFEVDKKTAEDELRNAGDSFLKGPESYRILESYGFRTARHRFAVTKEDALKAGREIGYPLAASVVSPDIIHKSDAGGVVLHIDDEAELGRAYGRIFSEVGRNAPQAHIEGIFIQEMVSEGAELILGAQYNEQLGHLLMFGLGGKYVEILKDVSFRLAPITRQDAEEMIKEVKAYEMLKGFRDIPAADLDALIESLLRLSQLVTDFPEIREIDLNPVFARKDGAVVVDARILL
ncbi:MAG: acetate--CoA ligase family protein [Lewinellaceae bacterium]|nr:acetate--CoA ligase family protein [Lewinellaceae bacterium]